MVESPADFFDPRHGIPHLQPVWRGAPADRAMMDSFDVLPRRPAGPGCRIYTFITTLRYVLEAAARTANRWGARPFPGRPVGRGPDPAQPAGRVLSAPGATPMRHGLTMGELGAWFIAELRADCWTTA